MVYDVVGRFSSLGWLFSWGIGYWDSVVVDVELWVPGFGCRCGGW